MIQNAYSEAEANLSKLQPDKLCMSFLKACWHFTVYLPHVLKS